MLTKMRPNAHVILEKRLLYLFRTCSCSDHVDVLLMISAVYVWLYILYVSRERENRPSSRLVCRVSKENTRMSSIGPIRLRSIRVVGGGVCMHGYR